MHTYDEIAAKISDMLKPYYISTRNTDVFEETMLKLAGIKTQPSRCQFSDRKRTWSQYNDPSKFYFKIWGLSALDAVIFMKFLQAQGDANANGTYIKPANDFAPMVPSDRDFDFHAFEIDIDVVANTILPLFENELSRLAKDPSAPLKDYQMKSSIYFPQGWKTLGIFAQKAAPDTIKQAEPDLTNRPSTP